MTKRTAGYMAKYRKRLAALLSASVLPVLCTSGVAAVELALILPVLMLMFVGIIEFTLIMYASSVVDGAAVAAARVGRTGYNPTSGSQKDYVYGIARERISGLLTPNDLLIASKAFSDFSLVVPLGSCVPGNCPQEMGGQRDIVEYTLTYPWQIITPGLSGIIGTDGVFPIVSTAVVRNEPTPPPINQTGPTGSNPAPTVPVGTPYSSPSPSSNPTFPSTFNPTFNPTSAPTSAPGPGGPVPTPWPGGPAPGKPS